MPAFELEETFQRAGTTVERYRLHNGLVLLYLPEPRAPVFTYQTWFRVGASDERPGKTGLAHLFEHLMFKGTVQTPEGEYDRRIEEMGGRTNAATWLDWTFYHADLPAGHLGWLAALEADRLANLAVTPEAFDSERKVVMNERRETVEDEPAALMSETLWATALTEHPYSRPTIGWMADIEGLTLADCQAFRKTWYAPDNAVLVVAGDVPRAELLATVAEAYGDLIPGHAVRAKTTREASRKSPIHKELSLPVTTERLMVAWQSPAATDADHPTLEVLNELLFEGDSGRLHRALITEGSWRRGTSPSCPSSGIGAVRGGRGAAAGQDGGPGRGGGAGEPREAGGRRHHRGGAGEGPQPAGDALLAAPADGAAARPGAWALGGHGGGLPARLLGGRPAGGRDPRGCAALRPGAAGARGPRDPVRAARVTDLAALAEAVRDAQPAPGSLLAVKGRCCGWPCRGARRRAGAGGRGAGRGGRLRGERGGGAAAGAGGGPGVGGGGGARERRAAAAGGGRAGGAHHRRAGAGRGRGPGAAAAVVAGAPPRAGSARPGAGDRRAAPRGAGAGRAVHARPGSAAGPGGGAGVGKSTLLRQIAAQAEVDVVVLALIGERGREVGAFLARLPAETRARAVVVVARADDPRWSGCGPPRWPRRWPRDTARPASPCFC
ncbi:MAG: insulinase family protein [bacterium]